MKLFIIFFIEILSALFTNIKRAVNRAKPLVGTQLCNATQYTNQFKQTQSEGVLDLGTNPNPFVMYCRYNPVGIGGDITPGTGVKLVDIGANDAEGPPIVDVRTLDADVIEGVYVLDPRNATKGIESMLSVAKKGAVVTFEASAAIARGAKVALVLASPGQVATQTVETVLGKALDKATASGELIRVEILAEGV